MKTSQNSEKACFKLGKSVACAVELRLIEIVQLEIVKEVEVEAIFT